MQKDILKFGRDARQTGVGWQKRPQRPEGLARSQPDPDLFAVEIMLETTPDLQIGLRPDGGGDLPEFTLYGLFQF